jgi:hypothetical protein
MLLHLEMHSKGSLKTLFSFNSEDSVLRKFNNRSIISKLQTKQMETRQGARVELVNWTALLGLEQGVYVMHTMRSWVVHVETLYGKRPGELFVLAAFWFTWKVRRDGRF